MSVPGLEVDPRSSPVGPTGPEQEGTEPPGTGSPTDPPPQPDLPETPPGSTPPLVHGGLYEDPNWAPRLADRLGSVVTDGGGVSEHWGRDIAPVMAPHLPNSFWVEVPEDDGLIGTDPAPPPVDTGEPEVPPVEPEEPDEPDLPITVTVTDVSPNGGTFKGGTGVTITGTGFIGVDPTTGVMFGTNPATGVVPDTPTQFTCLTPGGKNKQVVDVSVTGTAGTGTLPGGYTYDGATQFEAQSLSEPSEADQASAPSNTQQVAETIQESAEVIGQAAQDIGEAAQTLSEPAEGDEAPDPTSKAPSGSEGTTEAPEEGPTEYELDQYWGIEPEAGSAPEAEPEP